MIAPVLLINWQTQSALWIEALSIITIERGLLPLNGCRI